MQGEHLSPEIYFLLSGDRRRVKCPSFISSFLSNFNQNNQCVAEAYVEVWLCPGPQQHSCGHKPCSMCESQFYGWPADFPMDFMWHLPVIPCQNDLFKISEGVSGILTHLYFTIPWRGWGRGMGGGWWSAIWTLLLWSRSSGAQE